MQKTDASSATILILKVLMTLKKNLTKFYLTKVGYLTKDKWYLRVQNHFSTIGHGRELDSYIIE